MKENASCEEAVWSCEDNGEAVVCEFEDSFKPFFKMHDSSSYVAALEKKLSKLKDGRKQASGKEMLDELFEAKDDHMSHHIKDGVSNNIAEDCQNVSMDTKLQNLLIGKLYPERLALTNEELVHLLSSDKLNIAKEVSECEGKN